MSSTHTHPVLLGRMHSFTPPTRTRTRLQALVSAPLSDVTVLRGLWGFLFPALGTTQQSTGGSDATNSTSTSSTSSTSSSSAETAADPERVSTTTTAGAVVTDINNNKDIDEAKANANANANAKDQDKNSIGSGSGSGSGSTGSSGEAEHKSPTSTFSYTRPLTLAEVEAAVSPPSMNPTRIAPFGGTRQLRIAKQRTGES